MSPSVMGGLVGGGGPITQSFATGTATGYGDTLGGLVGSFSEIDNSYATGAVIGQIPGPAGGLVGNGQNVTNSYSIGQVSLSQDVASAPSKPYVGGFIGYAGHGLKKDCWDSDTARTEFGCGKNRHCKQVRGVSDEQLKSALPDGFSPKIWAQSPNVNNGYPYLLANPPR